MTIVITGFGALTPIGDDAESTWTNMLAGRSGVHLLEYDWAEELSVRIAGEVATDLSPWISRVEARRLDRVSQLAIAAASQAWEDSGLAENNPYEKDRTGVCVGTGIGGLTTTLEQWDVMHSKGIRRVSPFTVPGLMANAPAAHIGLMIGARAGVHTAVSACASGNEAISQGIDMLRLNRADLVLVGGTEAVINPLPIVSFSQMQALSKRNDSPETASRPWDVDRDGFVLSEGATIMVLERLESAQARGAKIYGTLAGSGVSADSHDLVQPDPSGYGQELAMKRALADANLHPSEIKHVNAHGTSTPQGDTTEAKSISSALGDAAKDVLVTSTKSMTGHLLGAAGALETFATVMALHDRVVPPTINIENLEPDLPVQIVANEKKRLPAEGKLAALNNSFGFGGHNVAIAVTNENVN
ncbi:beta-ketoacyl-acyl-carrier-protein synthase II [Propionimicrobium lymphophilum ACS-093-V-SCH5]|uniref:3-oxoacyl-[acyl-carrier-protein] synthase 2 n=1 Tax=Propionimicrobium lymphophilum ACS-093-V-SCH5 TaxID=883161 RepID=S2X064_9ACTN|nr:beta-ketoacyl-ACP synthase II [Propionimicrobium lymphophilum]EPD33354.1 beta-ketoacyl-acyl-carrier-protein synthase II [Propionimicrobium lymphophilum ACS-093-V-SCH5]